jgi:alpha-1,6-mannosyltransferase
MSHVMDVTMCWGPHSGGVRRYVLEKRAWMEARTAWRHTLAAPGVFGRGTLPIRGVPLPFSDGYRLPLDVFGVARQIERRRPDLIEIGDPYTLGWSALRAGQKLGVPVVGFCHSNVRLLGARWGGSALARMARAHARRIYRECSVVLAPSQDMLDELRSWGVDNACLQPLGVDTEVFVPHRQPQGRGRSWRSSLGLPDDLRVLLYAGRFAPEKNLACLSEAAAILGPSHLLVCVGAGPDRPAGANTITLPFTHDRIELAQMMAEADVFVHAGDEETFGLCVLEAMACGCPVVARRAGALKELVDHRVGASVPGSDAHAFAEAVRWTLARDRATLSAAARSRARQHDWRELMPRLFARYEGLLGQNNSTR